MASQRVGCHNGGMVFNRTVLYAGESQFGKYKIIDTRYNGRPARVLYGSHGSPQSGAARDDSPELLFDYNQRFLELMMSRRPKRVLIIGGGAFMLPIAAFHRFPAMHLDVVEIDPLLVTLAKDFFELPDDKRLTVHVGDGVAFIASSKEKYDMIIIDAFSGYDIPHHLLEQEAVTHYKQRLRKNGVIAINFISSYKRSRPQLAHELLASFGAVFSHMSLCQADSEYLSDEKQNLILIAGNEPLQFDYLQSRELDLYA